MRIVKYEDKYRDDMLYVVLDTQNKLGSIPRLNNDLLNVGVSYINQGDMFWIAIDESDRVIGCIGYNKLNSTQAKISRFYVKSDQFSKGIGTALISECEKNLKEQCIKELIVHTGDIFTKSKGFFTKNGYVEYQPFWLKKTL